MLKRTEMKPGVKIQFRNVFKISTHGMPLAPNRLDSPIYTARYGAGNIDNTMPKANAVPGTAKSPEFAYGDVATVTSEVLNFPCMSKQIRLEDSAGNAGWIYWSYVYMNADKI